jgi:hypothetical protein
LAHAGDILRREDSNPPHSLPFLSLPFPSAPAVFPMSAAFTLHDNLKPLPPPGRAEKFDKLPLPPPPDSREFSAPPPPPKIVHDFDIDVSGTASLLPPSPTLPSLGNLDHSTFFLLVNFAWNVSPHL